MKANVLVAGKLYEITNYARKDQAYLTLEGACMYVIPVSSIGKITAKYNATKLPPGDVVMWVGTIRKGNQRICRTLLHKDHGLCAVMNQWTSYDIACKLRLIPTSLPDQEGSNQKP